jgi:hypothetical protein
MQDIAQVLRRKRAQHAQLTKEIELLEQAEVTLRQVAPLLADEGEEEDNALLAEVDEEVQSQAAAAAPGSNQALRWP